MLYMLISGKLDKECLNTILSIDVDRYALEDFAQRYVTDNPGTVVHIFEWVHGYQSKPSVSTERLWSSGYVQPPTLEEPTETVDPL